jgi:aryl-alcohol dehydrogenase-like predicted oxidoreductase
MRYRRLGATGLKVSEISLGTWLTYDDPGAADACARLTDAAIEHGINLFDTADAYSAGRAETILGASLKHHPRESYVLATKVYWPTGEGPNDRGLSRKHVMAAVDRSLERLGTGYIDLYYCHWFDLETPVEETLRAMSDLVASGKVRYLGVSNWTAAQISEGLRVADRFALHPIVANQESYNMLDRLIERETIPLSMRAGIGQVVYSPLAQGVLTGKYRKGMPYPQGSRAANKNARAEVTVWDYLTDEILTQVEALIGIAADVGVRLSQLALAWVLRQPSVASALVGASSPKQLAENVEASDLVLSEEVLARIAAVLGPGTGSVKHNVVTAGL